MPVRCTVPFSSTDVAERVSMVGATLVIVVVVVAVSAPLSSSVRVTLMVYVSLAVSVGLSSRYWWVMSKEPPVTVTVCGLPSP